MQSKPVFWIIVFASVAFSCQQNKLFDRYTSIPNGWDKQEIVSYEFVAPDSINPYNLFVKLNYPHGKVTKDTLEYTMAKPSGELLGSGFTSVKEHKLWFKGIDNSFVFSEEGTYKVQIQQAMRLRGISKGIAMLEGVIDVGFSVEPLNK